MARQQWIRQWRSTPLRDVVVPPDWVYSVELPVCLHRPKSPCRSVFRAGFVKPYMINVDRYTEFIDE
jgi:hypothetical protein